MKALRILRIVERSVLVVTFLTMVALFFANVLFRQFGGTLASEFAWIDEAVRLLNLLLVFFAIGLALEYGRHVGIHTWRDRIAAATRLPVRRAIDVVGFGFSLYVAWLGYELTIFVLGTGQRSPTLNIPMGWIYLAPTFGFGLLALRYLLSFFGVIDRFSIQQGEET